jgi:hypothetical protein
MDRTLSGTLPMQYHGEVNQIVDQSLLSAMDLEEIGNKSLGVMEWSLFSLRSIGGNRTCRC